MGGKVLTILKRLLGKYAAAFFSLLILMIFYFFISDMSVSDTYDLIASPRTWAIFLLYLVGASFLIDRILLKSQSKKKWAYVYAYTIAGSILWFIDFLPIAFESIIYYFYFVLYGSIFTVFPFIIYYGVEQFIKTSWKKIAFFGIIPLFILLSIIIINPAIKKGFISEYGANYYTAEFENFNGQEHIEIDVEAGAVYLIEFDWMLTNENRHGMRISRNVHELGELKEVGDYAYQYHVNQDGKIVLTYIGDNIKGGIRISWEKIKHE